MGGSMAGMAVPTSNAGAGAGAAAAGGAGSAGILAAGGGGAGAAPASTAPIARQGKYAIELGDMVFEVDPQVGARITRFAWAGKNLLTGSDVDSLNWGSTFWPSPQARWNWPPVPEIDSQPYTAKLDGDALVLVGQAGDRAKVRVTKRFRALPMSMAIELEYTLENTDSAAASWAAWEISRVSPGGLTFFPTAAGAPVNNQLQLVQQAGVSWYQHDPKSVPMAGQKFAADGSGGWLAQLAGRTLFLKQFDDVPADKQAPSPEAEIEIYAAPGYVEVEPQGPYTQLMPGEHLTWRVRWFVREVPADISVELGSTALRDFAQKLASM